MKNFHCGRLIAAFYETAQLFYSPHRASPVPTPFSMEYACTQTSLAVLIARAATTGLSKNIVPIAIFCSCVSAVVPLK
jgi:hypothetical protein